MHEIIQRYIYVPKVDPSSFITERLRGCWGILWYPKLFLISSRGKSDEIEWHAIRARSLSDFVHNSCGSQVCNIFGKRYNWWFGLVKSTAKLRMFFSLNKLTRCLYSMHEFVSSNNEHVISVVNWYKRIRTNQTKTVLYRELRWSIDGRHWM